MTKNKWNHLLGIEVRADPHLRNHRVRVSLQRGHSLHPAVIHEQIIPEEPQAERKFLRFSNFYWTTLRFRGGDGRSPSLNVTAITGFGWGCNEYAFAETKPPTNVATNGGL
jgi:hypothetical protein